MYVHPQPRGRDRLWHHVETAFTAIAVWTERRPGQGEDADPLVLFHRPSGNGMLCVFDGVGGAGGTIAERTDDGQEHTHAWVAARRVRALTEEWFTGGRNGGLGAHIAGHLGSSTSKRRVRSDVLRDFPTTLAGLHFIVTGSWVRWNVLSAGDSRCYLARPDSGLQQLSRDDTEPCDALQQLVQDPPMTNMISADNRFTLNHWRGRAPLPCVLICATDGFFGYVDTPAQFEGLLWEKLLSAQDSVHWGALLAEAVNAYTGDDASLAVVALGFNDFDNLRARFRPRGDQLQLDHVRPMSRVGPEDRAALVSARERSWNSYREVYERRLPRERGGAG